MQSYLFTSISRTSPWMLRAGLGVLLAVCSFGQLQAGIIAGEFGNYQPESSGTLLSNPSTLANDNGFVAFASKFIVGSSDVTVDTAFLFYGGDGSLTKEFSIRADDGANRPSATTLATASINLSGGVSVGTWGTPREHALSTAITLSANTTYWAVAEGGLTGAQAVATWAAVKLSDASSPSVDIASAIAQTVFLSTDVNKGIYTQNTGGAWSRSFSSNNLNFQLGTASASAVPEPGMLSIFGLGALGMLGGFRRGRRKKGTTVAA